MYTAQYKGCRKNLRSKDIKWLEREVYCSECYKYALADIAEMAERKAGWDPKP